MVVPGTMGLTIITIYFHTYYKKTLRIRTMIVFQVITAISITRGSHPHYVKQNNCRSSPLLVVCLVTGLPCASIIVSALPWSAVTNRTYPLVSHDFSMTPMASSSSVHVTMVTHTA